jgi:hypothetical protein
VFTTVSTYTGQATHSLSIANDGLVYGKIYKLRYYAKNIEGNGSPSDSVLVALSALPG